MMDFSLPGIVIAIMAIEAAFWFWQESKIEKIENARLCYLKDKIEKYLSSNQQGSIDTQNLLSFFIKIIEEDEEFILPVSGDFKPHRTIFKLLIVSLFFSILYGLLSKSLSVMDITILDLKVFSLSLSLVCVTIALFFMSIAIYNGYKEFKYILEVKKKFKA